jgi:hypothetical protein
VTGALWSRALRYRVALLVCAAAALGFSDAVIPADMNGFAAGGRALLSGHFSAVYAHAENQAGPIQLLINWLLTLGSRDSAPLRVVVAAANVCLVVAALGACRRFAVRNETAAAEAPVAVARRELLVGLLVLLWLTPSGLWSGHPAEVLIAVLWLGAVRDVGRERWIRAGISLGVAAAIAPWGVLGFPAVLVCRRIGVSFAAGALGAIVTLLLYLPFLASGHFALFQATWPISPDSLAHLVAPGLHQMTWQLRLVQAAVVAGGTAGAALLLRRHRGAAPVALLVAGVLRVATDPVQTGYYWTSVGVVAIAIVAASPYSRRAWWAFAAAYVAWAGSTIGWTVEAAAITLALAVPIAARFRPASAPRRELSSKPAKAEIRSV